MVALERRPGLLSLNFPGAIILWQTWKYFCKLLQAKGLAVIREYMYNRHCAVEEVKLNLHVDHGEMAELVEGARLEIA